MRCPQCQVMEHTCVLNTVHREDGVVRRRRGCRACQIRWTTYEDIEAGSLINAFVPRPVVGDGIEEGRRP
jgi:transcriptional regulator NrdR family protein